MRKILNGILVDMTPAEIASLPTEADEAARLAAEPPPQPGMAEMLALAEAAAAKAGMTAAEISTALGRTAARP